MKKEQRMFLLLITDIILIMCSYYFALWIRFDGNINLDFYEVLIQNMIALICIKIFVFAFFKLYRSLWEYASIEELIGICFSVFAANTGAISFLVFKQAHLPRSVYIMSSIFDLLLIGGIRLAYRTLRRVKHRNFTIRSLRAKKVVVIGAGDAGALIIKELKNHLELNYNIIGIIDNDHNKKGHRLNGHAILGNMDCIESVVEKFEVDEIIIAIPSASKDETKKIVKKCKETNAKVKILPSVYELIDGKVTVNQIREVKIEDLLGRNPVHLDTELIESYILNKKIMVTGGGGSIGSELCRQIARFKPRELIIVDIYENNVYDLEIELNGLYNTYGLENELKLSVVIASVRDKSRMRSIMKQFNPEVIFHAAAHKHVPLMEDNPYEAVKNNIVGTSNMASLADEFDIQKFVLVSTDKAVNPTNVMGATKRFCEMIVQAYATISDTEFVAVRFGNVLGSNGSVIPLFKRQIANGGPITVTHEEITRYFMTIPEAAQLVLQAGAMAKGGEIFILDMGDPVKIIDLAYDLIRLSGFEPEEDIKILVTGLRPGEKLFEELLLEDEELKSTLHEKIYIGKPLDIEYIDIINKVKQLNFIAENKNSDELITTLRNYVPTYKENVDVNSIYLKDKDEKGWRK